MSVPNVLQTRWCSALVLFVDEGLAHEISRSSNSEYSGSSSDAGFHETSPVSSSQCRFLMCCKLDGAAPWFCSWMRGWPMRFPDLRTPNIRVVAVTQVFMRPRQSLRPNVGS